MKKGILMEMDDSYLTLLTPEGEFLRARKQDQSYTIGEEIHFFPHTDPIKSKGFFSLKNFMKKRVVWALMAAILFCLGSVIPIYESNKAYAYMSIDVNPSIELGMNSRMQVVELTGFNKEGKKIISQLDSWKKRDVSEVTKIILTEMSAKGFINKEEPIIISTVRTKQLGEKVESKLKANIEEIKQTVNDQQLEVNMITTSEEELKKAHNLGLTAGKYQERKNQSTLSQEKKENSKSVHYEKKQEKDRTIDPSEQPASTLPPGQLKKQVENNNNQNNHPNRDNKYNEESHRNGKETPPGQLKKMDDAGNRNNKGNNGKGQVKNQSNGNNKSNKQGNSYDNNK